MDPSAEIVADNAQSIQPTAGNEPTSTRPLSRRNERYLTFKVDRTNPDSVRSDLLILATLLITANFQVCMSPPGGLVQEKGPFNGTSVLAMKSPGTFIVLMLLNSLALYMSLNLIRVLTLGCPMFKVLYATLVLVAYIYAMAVLAVMPYIYMTYIFSTVYVMLFALVPATAIVAMRFKQPKRVNHIRIRLDDWRACLTMVFMFEDAEED